MSGDGGLGCSGGIGLGLLIVVGIGRSDLIPELGFRWEMHAEDSDAFIIKQLYVYQKIVQ